MVPFVAVRAEEFGIFVGKTVLLASCYFLILSHGRFTGAIQPDRLVNLFAGAFWEEQDPGRDHWRRRPALRIIFIIGEPISMLNQEGSLEVEAFE
ncbi:predicted protein [Plenodomus lingam JN3]|uniref:Uncharacterized protein n=1 Tax=Leptosphaeria maculans (strain JN3 / isolate v23.1.3 / race Av1-4-5-6-7-8) TaxID=985895 RepID=E5A6L1_LEPMJ|nr:predicted protein [Plenodomus lingam JN3]CBX99256.1 predicted protein [Plenodomus lingam JN3]